MTGKPLVVTALAILLASGLGASSQNPAEKQKADKTEQDQAIKVTTSLVEVRAVVTDRQGRVIKDLKKDDFEVFENKQQQEISFFSQITVGGTETPAGEAPAGNNPVAEPRRAAPSDKPVRTIVLFVDNLHLSDSNLLITRQTLKRFINEKLTDDDLVAVMTSGGTLGLFSQFTRDRRVLQSAVDKIGARGPNKNTNFTPYLAAQVVAEDREAMNFAILVLQQEDGISGPRTMMEGLARSRSSQILAETSYQRRVALSTLKALVDRLATLPGQRLVVTLSDGFTLYDQGASIDTSDLQAVTSRAAVAGVVIYTIDANGLAPPPGFDASMRGINGSPSANAFLSRSESDSEGVLNALARDTGGEPYRNTNDLVGSMKKALDNNSSFYAIGYYPAGEEESAKFRRIAVRVKNHPEYSVRAQQGYLPSALAREAKEAGLKTPQQKLAEAAIAPLAVAEIGVFATADYIETEVDAAQVSLQVFIDGSKLKYTEESERHRFALEMLSLVFDASGRPVKTETTSIQTALLPANVDRAKQRGFRYSRRLELKPGTYQIRIGVRELETNRIGTAAAWVEVPALSGKKVVVSNILLTDAESLDFVTTLGKENLTLQVGTRQGLKAYRQKDALGYYLRVYPPAKFDASDLAGLTYSTEVRQGDVVVAESGWRPLPTAMNTSRGIELGRQFPLAGIPPGFYELKVSVKSVKSKSLVVRTAAFEVLR